jgi:elongation factor P
MAILHGGNFCRVMTVQHMTPGNKRGFVQAKLRNLKTGNSFEHRFRSEDRIEKADLEEREMEFLYASGDEYHFMNTETYEQVVLTPDTLGEAVKYMTPNTRLMVEFFEERAIGINLPTAVNL